MFSVVENPACCNAGTNLTHCEQLSVCHFGRGILRFSGEELRSFCPPQIVQSPPLKTTKKFKVIIYPYQANGMTAPRAPLLKTRESALTSLLLQFSSLRATSTSSLRIIISLQSIDLNTGGGQKLCTGRVVLPVADNVICYKKDRPVAMHFLPSPCEQTFLLGPC